MTYQYNKVVFIGRFSPPHHAHLYNIRKALEFGEKVVILIGSAYRARSFKNPFKWFEREQMIRYALNSEENARVRFEPVPDVMYNDQQWVQGVQNAVDEHVSENDSVALIGHEKDRSSFYLKLFPNWDFIETGEVKGVNATEIRNLYFGKSPEYKQIAEKYLPKEVKDYLSRFTLKDAFEYVADEFKFIREYKKAWENAP